MLSGLNQILDPERARRYMAAIGLFSGTEFFYAGAILLEMGGALSLWLGWRTRAGAAALILFLIPATMIFHRTSMSFVLDATVQDQQFHVMKNLAIFGGLAYVVAYGAGPISPDARRTLHRDGRKGTGDWPHLEKYPSQRPGADGAQIAGRPPTMSSIIP